MKRKSFKTEVLDYRRHQERARKSILKGRFVQRDKNMMKAALYLRVSTDKQELENQLEPLKKFAKGRGFKVVQVYRDTASGKKADRTAFNKMLKDAHQKRFDVILVWALDRLSREGMSRTVQLIEMLERMNIAVISYTEPYLDTTNELARNILLAVVSTLAKAEREKISERTKAGLARVKRAGRKLGRPEISLKKRKKALQLIKGGMSKKKVAKVLGVARSSILNWQGGVKKRVSKRVG